MVGVGFVRFTPVNGSPIFNTIKPERICTSPRPANSVSRQPVKLSPSKSDCQSSPSNGAEGLAAACLYIARTSGFASSAAFPFFAEPAGGGGLGWSVAQPARQIKHRSEEHTSELR